MPIYDDGRNNAPFLLDFDLDTPTMVKQGSLVYLDLAPHAFDPDEGDRVWVKAAIPNELKSWVKFENAAFRLSPARSVKPGLRRILIELDDGKDKR